MNQNPYLFIVGCARSGTTLLQRIVDAHPQIAIMPEMHWIANFKKRDADPTARGLVTRGILYTLLENKRFAQLRISRVEFEELVGHDETLSYADFLTRLFELYRKSRNKPLVGNKTPVYVQRIATLHHLWPTTRIVHLIRDGRDVCLSVMNWKKGARIVGRRPTWTKDPVSTIAVWWKRKVSIGREAGRALGSELYYEIRYEDLVGQPEKECRALCEFLGVRFSDAMLRSHEGRTKTHPRRSRGAWLPITSGLRDWRSQMTVENVERFEAVAGDLLDELDYLRGETFANQEAKKLAS